MSEPPAFERILASLYDAMLDDARWPAASALIDEACGITGNDLMVGEGPTDDVRARFVGAGVAKPPSSRTSNRAWGKAWRSRGSSRHNTPTLPRVAGTLPGRSTAAHRYWSRSWSKLRNASNGR